MRKLCLIALLLLALPLFQGCGGEAMERAMALADQPEPGSPEALALAAEMEARGKDPCKVLALHRYCLGGSAEPLLKNREPAKTRELDGITEYDFREKYRMVTISVYDGKIMKVERDDRPANWRMFGALKTQMERHYGLSEDQSSFPAGAETNVSRLNAIYSGQGEARLLWDRPGWSAVLQWDNLRFIHISFQDDELKEAYEASGTKR